MTFTNIEDSLCAVQVILPYELSIVISRLPLPPLDRLLPKDDCIKVCATRNIKYGTIIKPRDGVVRTDKLPEIPFLKPHDIRTLHGAIDIVDTENRRTCNWVRFIQHDTSIDDVNIISFGPYGRDTSFMVIKDITYGQELSACLTSDPRLLNAHLIKWNPRLYSSSGEDVPLDLSQSSERSKRPCPSSDSYDSDLGSHSDSSRSNSPTMCGPPLKVPALHPYSRMDFVNNLNRIRYDIPTTFTFRDPETVRPCPNASSRRISNPLKCSTTKRREKSMLPCSSCGKSFDRPSLLKRHTRTHTGEKPHVCDVCSKGFSTSSSLNTHRRIHSGEKPHECLLCGKKFTASSNLYYHKMTHSKDKPHKCTHCTRSFPTPGDLRCHMYIHNGLWPFKCTVCNKGFSKFTNLRNHKIMHEPKNLLAHHQPNLVVSVS